MATPTHRQPHPRERRMIFKNVDREGWTQDIDAYLGDGGYEELKKALTMSQVDVVNEVKASGLRGRGGAGFPCGVKWGFIKQDSPKPIYLICNADESEPGTFKDRYIIHQDPHQLIEGMIISCYAVNAKLAYLYIRGEFPEGAVILERALAEARARGFLGKNIQGSGFDCEIYVHRGAGAYICGEETGLIESLEGKRPYPRIKPPYFPAVLGLYQCPTIVNNVETLCHVKHIIRMGGAEYAKIGKPNNTGTRILCVSGDVQRPGYFEVELGSVTMGEVINELCGGMKEGRKLKAIIPGGSSAKVLRGDEKFKVKEKGPDGVMVDKEITVNDIPMDFDTLAAVGSMAGSGGVIVMDDSRDMVETLANLNEFYAHESCGQCTPCREGSLWMQKITRRMVSGEGAKQDPAVLKSVADNIAGKTICAFGEACAWPTQSFVGKFAEEFAAKATKNVVPREVSDGVALEDGVPVMVTGHEVEHATAGGAPVPLHPWELPRRASQSRFNNRPINMGLVYAELTLKNPSDESLQPMSVTALVDSAATFLCVPPHVAMQLKLPELHKRETTLADNTKKLCPYVGPVYVKFQNRECLVGAMVLGDQVLLGALPMEDMDVQIDPRTRRLVANPASPNVQTAMAI